MKKDLTELVFILDRSGSMTGLESDTIGGYNSMMERQKKESGDVIVTTVLFDDSYELLHDRTNLQEIAPITGREYFVRGTTALLDAVGRTINKIGNAQKLTAEDERAEHVVFVIITDGMENSSREFGYERVNQMVEHQKKKYGWEFIFLGANIDAVAEADRFGIGEDRAANYCADGKGTVLNYEVVGEAVSSLRRERKISGDWKEKIERDCRERVKRRD